MNHKRVHGLYRLEGLQVRMRVRRRKRVSQRAGARADSANEHWSMDFVHDQLSDGRRFRILTVIDQWSRQSLSLEAGFSLTGKDVP